MKAKVCFSIILLTMIACAPLRRSAPSGPYRGKVVDAKTKEPIVGAVVLIYWNREAPGLGHGPVESFLDAEEAITDSNGEFVIARNPPVNLVPGTWISDPDIIIFYPGYGHFPLFHTAPPWQLEGLPVFFRMMKTGIVIELPRFKTKEERLNSWRRVIHGAVPEKKKPNLMRLLNQEEKELGLQK